MTSKCTTINTQDDLPAGSTNKVYTATEKQTVADVKTLVNDIRSKLQGNYLTSLPSLGIGSTPTAVANAAFDFLIGGIRFTKAAVAAGTAPGNDVIPQSLYGAVAIDTQDDGTLTVAEAAANSTGYASAALAIAGIPALGAGKTRLGTVTVIKSDGAFTFGTTNLNAANVTTVYTDGQTLSEAIGDAVS